MREIAIIDLWTDANRGDNALQVSLVRLLREANPGATVRGVFRFGTNELEAARPEIDATSAELDEVVGGIRRTAYAAAHAGRTTRATHRVVALLSFVEAWLCIACFRALGDRSRRLIGAARHRSLTVVRDADIVVWKGKNLRGYDGLAAVTRALTLGGAGYFASLLRARIDCVNASVWPIEGRASRLVYRRAFRHCRSMTVRDPSSVTNARALLRPEVPVRECPDLSFALFRDAPGADPPPEQPERGTVALTVTAWGDRHQQERHLAALAAAVERLRALGATRFVVVPQVTRAAEDSSALVEALRARVRREGVDDVEVLPGAPSIDELVATYAGCRLLIGGRMHSCVFARAAGVPFVALSYDRGPKWEILSSFWDPQLILDYDVEPTVLATACDTLWHEGPARVRDSDEAWRRCVDGAASNLDLLDA